MIYDVYRMFREGQKLSIAEVKASAPLTGELRISTIRPHIGAPPLRMATLSGGEYGAGMLPSLNGCVVAKFNATGEMLIIGTETLIRKPVYKGQNDTYPQQWLCKPVDPKVVRRPPSVSNPESQRTTPTEG